MVLVVMVVVPVVLTCARTIAEYEAISQQSITRGINIDIGSGGQAITAQP
jgi:hypothetical protein